MADVSRWRGSQVFEDARKEVEDTLRRLFAPYAEGGGPGSRPTWNPHVDMAENDQSYIVTADLPGIDPKDVEITLHEGVLTVKGERRDEREEKGKTFHKVERSFGLFERRIALPGGVDADAVKASSANGVITITVPKKPGPAPKKIPLNPGP